MIGYYLSQLSNRVCDYRLYFFSAENNKNEHEFNFVLMHKYLYYENFVSYVSLKLTYVEIFLIIYSLFC